MVSSGDNFERVVCGTSFNGCAVEAGVGAVLLVFEWDVVGEDMANEEID